MSDQSSESRLEGEELTAAVGAVIFASGEPVTVKQICEALDGVSRDDVRAAIEQLSEKLASTGCGIHLESIAGGHRMATEPRVGAWVRRYFRHRNRTRLSAAGLETLAIVAYKQPVTGPEIQSIRGKDPGAALKSLLDKKMIKILGRKKVVGSPLLYGTSKDFLVHFGLSGLRDLPSIDEFDEFVSALDAGQSEMFRPDENVEIEPLEGEEAEPAADGDTAVEATSAETVVPAAPDADSSPAEPVEGPAEPRVADVADPADEPAAAAPTETDPVPDATPVPEAVRVDPVRQTDH